jgi:3-hydroxyisobutyrate dehydrogenase-like beta-hydroxyacid dehydrogenase
MKRLTKDQVKLGFIGLGNMGSRIAQRLLGQGYQLSVYDRNLVKAETIAAQGAPLQRAFMNWRARSMLFFPA